MFHASPYRPLPRSGGTGEGGDVSSEYSQQGPASHHHHLQGNDMSSGNNNVGGSNGPAMAYLPSTGPRQPQLARPGDWQCPAVGCGNMNFSKRSKCNRCGEPKPRPQQFNQGGGYADSGTGGARGTNIPQVSGKTGDWACMHCGNVNWARRERCNVCNASKPTLHEEPRMGRGGGHYDLQDPSDRKRHDSDDEKYDEFGRKKKKKNNAASAGSGVVDGGRGSSDSKPMPYQYQLHQNYLDYNSSSVIHHTSVNRHEDDQSSRRRKNSSDDKSSSAGREDRRKSDSDDVDHQYGKNYRRGSAYDDGSSEGVPSASSKNVKDVVDSTNHVNIIDRQLSQSRSPLRRRQSDAGAGEDGEKYQRSFNKGDDNGSENDAECDGVCVSAEDNHSPDDFPDNGPVEDDMSDSGAICKGRGSTDVKDDHHDDCDNRGTERIRLLSSSDPSFTYLNHEEFSTASRRGSNDDNVSPPGGHKSDVEKVNGGAHISNSGSNVLYSSVGKSIFPGGGGTYGFGDIGEVKLAFPPAPKVRRRRKGGGDSSSSVESSSESSSDSSDDDEDDFDEMRSERKGSGDDNDDNDNDAKMSVRKKSGNTTNDIQSSYSHLLPLAFGKSRSNANDENDAEHEKRVKDEKRKKKKEKRSRENDKDESDDGERKRKGDSRGREDLECHRHDRPHEDKERADNCRALRRVSGLSYSSYSAEGGRSCEGAVARDRENYRDRERDRDKERERDRDRNRERERDRDRYKERERNKERDKERDKDNERDRDKDMDRDRDTNRVRDRDRPRGRDKDRDRDQSRY